MLTTKNAKLKTRKVHKVSILLYLANFANFFANFAVNYKNDIVDMQKYKARYISSLRREIAGKLKLYKLKSSIKPPEDGLIEPVLNSLNENFYFFFLPSFSCPRKS